MIYWLLCRMILQEMPPSIPGKITDEGLLLVAFMLVIGAWAIWLVVTKVIPVWRGGNGYRAQAEALSALRADVMVMMVQVDRLCHDYHDRLVPALQSISIATLRSAGMDKLADIEENRVNRLNEIDKGRKQ